MEIKSVDMATHSQLIIKEFEVRLFSSFPCLDKVLSLLNECPDLDQKRMNQRISLRISSFSTKKNEIS